MIRLTGWCSLVYHYVTHMVLLRHWRDKRGYSVRQLARRAGVTHVSIVRIENGQASPNVAMLEKLAKALGITVRDFFPVERPKGRRRAKR